MHVENVLMQRKIMHNPIAILQQQNVTKLVHSQEYLLKVVQI